MILEPTLRGKVGDGERLFREDAEEALDLVQPRRTGGGVVKMNTRVFTKPGADLLGVMCGGVIEHDVELFVRTSGPLYS